MFLILLLLQIAATAVTTATSFGFFQPSVSITSVEQSALDRGSPIARLLPSEGQEDGVFTAVQANIDGDRLVAWERRIEELKKGGYTLTVGRFSDPPRIEDLAGLELDKDDLSAIRKCRPGNCQIKLSGREMAQLRQPANRSSGDSTAAVQQAFRELVLKRVQLYRTKGQVLPYEDEHVTVQPAAHFATVLEHMEFLSKHAPQVVEYLRGTPSAQTAGAESFFYWSKERAAGKPIISVTQVNIFRFKDAGMPDALIVSRDIFSSHYINASVSVTALMRGPEGKPNYLVYMNRTEVDLLHGMFAGVIRNAMNRRMRSDSTKVLQTYRRRLESGEPPAPSATAELGKARSEFERPWNPRGAP